VGRFARRGVLAGLPRNRIHRRETPQPTSRVNCLVTLETVNTVNDNPFLWFLDIGRA
jgi:hypothetical protein